MSERTHKIIKPLASSTPWLSEQQGFPPVWMPDPRSYYNVTCPKCEFQETPQWHFANTAQQQL